MKDTARKGKVPGTIRSGRSAVSTFVALALLCPATVLAQASDAETADDTASADGITEVLVTARRRSESLARVPGAMTAIGAEQLVERAIRTDSDLQLTAPGLTIRQTQGNN